MRDGGLKTEVGKKQRPEVSGQRTEDGGRQRRDGHKVSVRDKVGQQETQQGDEWMNRMTPAGWDGNDLAQRREGAEKRQGKFSHLRFHSTFDIIEAVEKKGWDDLDDSDGWMNAPVK